jgi:amidophosphoribosyltransferase
VGYFLLSGEVKEACGVAAVSIFDDLQKHPKGSAAFYLMKMMLQIQNRGQLSAGITTYNKDRQQILETHKDNGLVAGVFRTNHGKKNSSLLKHFAGSRGIGHVRYATSGATDRNYAMPFERQHGRIWKWFSFGFNGNLANFSELKNGLADSNYHLVRNTDTEVIMHYLSKQFLGPEKKDLVEVFGNLSKQFDGSYVITFMNADGDLVILRDPLGIKPVCYSQEGKLFAAASENVAIKNLGMYNTNYLQPGEMLVVGKKRYDVERFAKSKRKAHCMFEWVYFANVSSVLDDKSVYEARWRLGETLAKREFVKPDDDTIVIGVPETSKPMGDAYAYTLGIPGKEGLLRNRYAGRIFIEGEKRDEKVRDKFNLIRRVLRGKKLIVVDDSIVRGTTSAALVRYLKRIGGAKEVHFRVACPPIKYPCFYGIDFSTCNELIASKACADCLVKTGAFNLTEEQNETIRKQIGADSLMYQRIEDLPKAIGLPKDHLCMACLTGEYPTPAGETLKQDAIKNVHNGNGGKRTYE